MAYRKRTTSMKAPYLRRLILMPDERVKRDKYPFNLPFLTDGFQIDFTTPITIIVGENGTGKSTLIEAIGALAGYDEAGGGKGYMPVDHSNALDRSGSVLGAAFRGQWLPKLTNGWFFRAETFFSVARYLDDAAREPLSGPAPNFLSWSHGEGFVRFFEERMSRQGFFLLDEPESALSPARQIDLLRLLTRIDRAGNAQVILATHSPLLMACPNARLLRLTRFGLDESDFRDTEHFRMMRDFTADPERFIAERLAEDE